MSQPENTAVPSGARPFLGGAEAWFWAATVAVLLGIFWNVVCTVPGVPWNSARLAPSFALARGLPFYALRESGAQLGWMYGPVFPLFFLPAGWCENPTVGLMVAAVLNIGILLLPVFLAVRVAIGGHTRSAALTTVFGAVLLLAHPVTQNAFFMVHVDALCVGFGLLACMAIYAGVVGGWRPGLPVAALAWALGVGTKQIAVFVAPAVLLWLFREGYRKEALRWSFWLAVAGGGFFALCLFFFGPEELVFNTFLVPSRAVWGDAFLLRFRLKELFTQSSMWAVALGLGWLAFRPVKSVMAPRTASFLRLLGWVALWQLPVGLLASIRGGGDLNSVHSLYYALVAGLIVVGSWMARPTEVSRPAGRTRGMVAVIVALGLAADGWLVFERKGVWTPYRGLEELLVMARGSPGKIYLPWNPLITIVSDHKVYPFDDALFSLSVAKLEPPFEAIRAAVPAGAVIFYQEPAQSHFALNYFGARARPPAKPSP